MSQKLKFLAAGALVLLILGCQMPAGVGPARNLVGEDGEELTGAVWAPGSLSVEMDEERGVAVYVNENGERFDVAAEEYPGGPVITCVEVESFVEIPPSDDPDALAVKAIVAGVRNDGELGAWAIHPDDSIHLTVGEDGEARCLTGADPASIVDGMQSRYGWRYQIVGSASDDTGRTMIIVGVSKNPHGFVYGSVEVLPDSPVAVYWKVWRLPFSRFRIITPPRVIGTYEKAATTAAAPQLEPRFAEILARLRQFFLGRLQSFLADLDRDQPVAWDAEGQVYVVRGTDQDGNIAVARIDTSGGIVIAPVEPPAPELPDLVLSKLSGTATRGESSEPVPEGGPLWSGDLLTITVEVANLGDGDAEASPVRLRIPAPGSPEIDLWSAEIDLGALAAASAEGATASVQLGPYAVGDLVGAALDDSGAVFEFPLIATVNPEGTVEEDEAEDPSLDQKQVTLHVGTPKLVIAALGPASITEGDAVGATVTNEGSAESVGLELVIGITNDEGQEVQAVDVSDPGLRLAPGAGEEFTFVPPVGTWELFARLGSDAPITAALVVQSKSPPPPTSYESFVVETYPVFDEAALPAEVPLQSLGFMHVWLYDANGDEVAVSTGGDGSAFWFYNILTPDLAKVVTPIPAGTVFYAKIIPLNGNSGRYAVRLLDKPSKDFTGWKFFDAASNESDAYEPDDSFKVGADDSNLATLTLGGGLEEQRLDRYGKSGETDWVKIVLP
jgi:hypothetical protein